MAEPATTRDITVQSPPPLVLDISTSAQQKSQWIQWRDNLNLFFIASNIKDTKQKRALLLYLGGEELRKINSTIPDEESDTYEKILTKLNEHFETKVCITFERNQFRKITPQPGESAKTFITRLKQASASCDFEHYNADAAIIDQFIEHTDRPNLRRKLMRTADLTLTMLLETASEEENVQAQATSMENNCESVNKMKLDNSKQTYYSNSKYSPAQNYGSKYNKPRNPNFEYKCFGCGGQGHKYGTDECPAFQMKCNFCQRPNHLEKFCIIKKKQGQKGKSNYQANMKKQANYNLQLDEEASEDEYLFQLNAQPDVIIKLDDHPIKFLRDSGASVDVIDNNTYQELSGKRKIELYNTNTKIFTYGAKEPLPLEGMFYANANYKNSHHLTKIFVTKAQNSGCILGRQTEISLGLIELAESINYMKTENDEINKILDKHKPIFQGLGKLKNVQVKLDIDESVKPIAQPLRRIPFHLRKKVDEKIKQLEELDIIEKVTESTSWVSPIVAVPKGNTVRITIDMRKANTAISRTHYPIPTLGEVLSKFSGCEHFTKIDLLKGYHQIELHPESRYITTFVTHTGVYRYKRMVQGVSSAFQDYQYHISKLFENQELIQNICDDIIVGGKSQTEHNENLETCLRILKENGLTVNSDKCIWNAPEVEFYGHIISKEGVKPTESKIEAIKAFSTPKNTRQLSSFLGLVNYLGGFINNLATLTAPLRKLMKKESEWKWTETEENAFSKLKRTVSSKLCIAHFNAELQTYLITDASPVGIGGILVQKQTNGSMKPIAYASKSLTKTEMKYSQTEREALGVVWCCERFHIYIYGSKFTILSDHQPLKILYSHEGKPSPRILRWGLRLQSYNFQIEYIPGCSNPADYLSIKPMKSNSSSFLINTEDHINSIIAYATPKAVSLSEIIKESENDVEIGTVIKALVNNNWKKPFPYDSINDYYKVREELTYKSGILLRNEKIVIPNTLRKRLLNAAHESHLGIVKTKALLRDKVWWPAINKQVEDMIKSCLPCAGMKTAKYEPMKHNNNPITTPWNKVHIDLCGPINNEYVLGIIDSTTRWPETFITRSTNSETIIKLLKRCFATYGFPNEIVTDNAPNLISVDVKQFCEEYAIKHTKATPYWPQANSEIEKFYGIMMKFIKTVTSEGRNWKDQIHIFLINYRNSPHCTTGISPARFLMNRPLRDKIPHFESETNQIIEEIRRIDSGKKAKSKKYYDMKHSVAESKIKVGDFVLMKRRTVRKTDTKFETTPILVPQINGNAVTVMKDNKTYTRNSSEFQKVPNIPPHQNKQVQIEDTKFKERNIENDPIENIIEEPRERENENNEEEAPPQTNEIFKSGNILPKRNESVYFKLNNEWKKGIVSQNQPKKGGKWGKWINITPEGEEEFCVDWPQVESWYEAEPQLQ